MTKEEIKEVRKKIDTSIWTMLLAVYHAGKLGADLYETAEKGTLALKKDLHSQGVVIKVDRETTDYIKCPCDDCTAEHKLIDEWGYFCDMACGKRSHWISRQRGWQDIREAGCVAVELLI